MTKRLKYVPISSRVVQCYSVCFQFALLLYENEVYSFIKFLVNPFLSYNQILLIIQLHCHDEDRYSEWLFMNLEFFSFIKLLDIIESSVALLSTSNWLLWNCGIIKHLIETFYRKIHRNSVYRHDSVGILWSKLSSVDSHFTYDLASQVQIANLKWPYLEAPNIFEKWSLL